MIKNLILLLVLMSAFCAHAGTGAIPSGENIKLLKDNLRFKTTDTKIMTNDSDDPTSVAKDAEIGSMYIRSTTGVLYQKQDSGSSTNWLPLLIGPAGSGTDNRIVRWNGTGVPLVQDSLVTLDDLGALSGLTQLDVDNVQINGNTILTTDTNGDLTLDPDGTGKVVINSDLDVLGTITNISASTLTVTNATITANDGGNQATADSLDSGLIVEMSDATDATIHYDSSVTSKWKAGEVGSTSEIITATHAQDITAKTLLEVDNIQINGNTIASTDLNGNVILNPNGTGGVNLPDLTISQPAYIDSSGNLVSQDISLTADVSGILPVANGGTGVDSSLASNGQLLIGNGTGFSIANLTGTADQVSVTNGSGTITLATPQNIATTSSPSFTGLTLSGLTQNSVPYIGASGVLTEDNPSFTYNGSTLSLSNAGSATLLNLDQTGSGTSLNIDNSGSGDFVIVDTDALVVQASKEVGIGIANPTSTLHVIGDAQVDDININATSISVTSTNDDLNISSNGTGDVNIIGNSVYLDGNTNVNNAVISGTSDVNPLTLLGSGERVVVSDPLEFSNSTPSVAAASSRTKIAVNSSGNLVKLNSDGLQKEIDKNRSKDIFHQEDFEYISASNWSTGNNASFLTAGTLDGALTRNTSSPISNLADFKYTASTSSTNDWISSPAITLDAKQRGQFIGISFYYKWSGSVDVPFVVKCTAGDTATFTDSLDVVETASASTRFSTSIFISSACTEIKYGFHLTNAPTSGDILIFDDVELSTNPFVYKDLSVTGSWNLNEVASNWNRTGSNVIYRNSSSPTFTETGDTSGLTFSNDGTDGFKVIATKPCLFISATAISSSSGAGVNVLKNGSVIKVGGGASYDGPKETPLTVEMVAGDYITWVTSSLDGSRDMSFSFSTVCESEHVITPAKSNMTDWVLDNDSFTTTEFGTLAQKEIYTKRVGSDLHVRGYIQTGTVGTLTASLNLVGRNIAIDKLPNGVANTSYLGKMDQLVAGNFGAASNIRIFSDGINTSSLFFSISASGTDYDKENGSSILASSQGASFEFTVPIEGWTSDVVFLGAIPNSNFSADIAADGTISNEKKEFLGTCTNAHPSVCTFSRSFKGTPTCLVGNATDLTAMCALYGLTSSGFNIKCWNETATNVTTSTAKSVFCHTEQ